MHLRELKDKSIKELVNLAESMGLENVARLRKQDIIFAILKAHGSFYAQLPKFLKKRKALKSSIKYHQINSVVYKHFILKKQSFKEL